MAPLEEANTPQAGFTAHRERGKETEKWGKVQKREKYAVA
jgi:hypothetical protein